MSAFFNPPEMCLCPRCLEISDLEKGPSLSKLSTSISNDSGLDSGLMKFSCSSDFFPVEKKVEGKKVGITNWDRTSHLRFWFLFSLHHFIILSVPMPHFSMGPAR
ncbi:hypothetical protein PRO82_000032 [Candidatus Protochlamydia amoebophila]|nr:hypothetical protein [Candidatus Protochlamydia amoebophila]